MHSNFKGMENTEQIAQIKVLILTNMNLEEIRLEDCRHISEQISPT